MHGYREYRVVGELTNSNITTDNMIWIGQCSGLIEGHAADMTDTITALVRRSGRAASAA
jgi:hypothetical protein